MNTYSLNRTRYFASSALLLMLSIITLPASADGSAADYQAIPPVISLDGQNDKPNIMVVLDNSNSMDEDVKGRAVGSDSNRSKSEIARNAIKGIIDTFGDSMRMGLMAYKQTNVVSYHIHDSQYDVSYTNVNYLENHDLGRASQTKAIKRDNPTDPTNFIYFNVALPMYSPSNYGNKFCYSKTAKFDNGSETYIDGKGGTGDGPWDTYECFNIKTGDSDNGKSGLSAPWYSFPVSPTDSDLAQNILDFGTHLTWQYIGKTWFSNTSPGGGQTHVPISDVDASQKTKLFDKLATSQFVTTTDTPLRNAGLTPIEGTLKDAKTYFSSYVSGNQCVSTEKDYVILVTDGLPSVDASGNVIKDTNQLIIDAAAEAANLSAQGIKTYVIGFALPVGTDPTLLDKIAIAGGTEKAYPADDAVKLNDALSSIFLGIINRASSGTGAAVLANNSRGDGAFYQALYIPKKQDKNGKKVTWVGVLNSLFIDENGHLREDTNGNKQIDDYSTDKVVEYYYDSTKKRTLVNLKSGPDKDNLTKESVPVEIEDLKYIWSARDQLASITDPITQRDYTNSAATGRAIYTSTTGTSLTNFVSLSALELAALKAQTTAAELALQEAEKDLDESAINRSSAWDKYEPYKNIMDAVPANELFVQEAEETFGSGSEEHNDAISNYEAAKLVAEDADNIANHEKTLEDYVVANEAWLIDKNSYDAAFKSLDNALNSLYFAYMALPSTDADKTVRWIRGEEQSGYRSRQLDWNSDGTDQVWRLGDIIHSTPVVVAAPNDRYDLTNGDPTYAAFVDQYYNRRHVIYVGANDGMLHAFNAGFWDDASKSFKTTNAFTNSDGNSTVTAHPLGSELWGYIPKAALPHLKWLTSTSYGHTYYVDGEPLTFDANIFADDADHPNGWGTLLVVPMRLGGGEFSVDTDGDGNTDETLRSSISIFDITNPEVAPKLLAEISHEDLGFTTSKPALVKARIPSYTGNFSSPTVDRWLLAFGSGPNILDDATSDQDAKLFLYDLESKSFVNNYDPLDLSYSNGFVGDIGVADWDSDYVDDALYFGLNSGVHTTETGKIARIRLGSNDTTNFDESTWLSFGKDHISTLLDSGRSMVGAPLAARDDSGKRWVFGGTGRLFVTEDNIASKQQYFYGIIDPSDSDSLISSSNLEDVTQIRVFTNGEVDKNGNAFQIPSGKDINNFNQLEYAISNDKQGWYQRLTYTNASEASGRNINGAARFRSIIFFTEYVPSNAADKSCSPEGSSGLHAVHYKTGTATPYDVIGVDELTTKNEGELVLSGLDLGQGLASAPTIITNNSGTKDNSAGTVAMQLGTGELKLINFGEGGTRGGRESWQEIEMDGIDL